MNYRYDFTLNKKEKLHKWYNPEDYSDVYLNLDWQGFSIDKEQLTNPQALGAYKISDGKPFKKQSPMESFLNREGNI